MPNGQNNILCLILTLPTNMSGPKMTIFRWASQGNLSVGKGNHLGSLSIMNTPLIMGASKKNKIKFKQTFMIIFKK